MTSLVSGCSRWNCCREHVSAGKMMVIGTLRSRYRLCPIISRYQLRHRDHFRPVLYRGYLFALRGSTKLSSCYCVIKTMTRETKDETTKTNNGKSTNKATRNQAKNERSSTEKKGNGRPKPRSISHSMAQDSAEEPPRRSNQGYGAQLVLQNGCPNRQK